MKSLLLVALVFVANVFAEENAPAAGTTESVVTPSAEKVVGILDIRPSYQGKGLDGSWDYRTENFAELGYQFDSNSILSYRQTFNTNLHNSRPAANGGLDLTAQAGFFRGQLRNLIQQEDLSLGYEGRAYLPTDAASRDAGMITAVRNYFRAAKTYEGGSYMAVLVVPILHMYDRGGVNNAANPFFENRVYLDGYVQLMDKLSFELPIVVGNTRHRSFAVGATNNDAWSHKLWIEPELMYTIDPHYKVGVSYYSENLMTPDFSTANFGDGFERGTFQLAFTAIL